MKRADHKQMLIIDKSTTFIIGEFPSLANHVFNHYNNMLLTTMLVQRNKVMT